MIGFGTLRLITHDQLTALTTAVTFILVPIRLHFLTLPFLLRLGVFGRAVTVRGLKRIDLVLYSIDRSKNINGTCKVWSGDLH